MEHYGGNAMRKFSWRILLLIADTGEHSQETTMKKMLIAATMLCAMGVGTVAGAQDVTKISEDYKVEFENDQVRILRVKRAPHSKVPMHSHPDAILMMITDNDQKITTPDGKSVEAHLKAGEVVFRNAVTHSEESISDKPLEVVLVELKNSAKK
jgi:quercetin dioxygenase-like cupin family protein